MRETRRIAAAISLLLGLGACGADDGAEEAPASPEPEGYVISGRLLDAETGDLVSRRRIYIHAFNDAIDHQVSLDPRERHLYRIEMRQPRVRLRVYDGSHVYEGFETTLTLAAGTTTYDVRLQPTHWVLLHGRLLDDETSEPVPVDTDNAIGGGVLLYLEDETGEATRGPIWLDEDGRYRERVPRRRIRFRPVNTGGVLVEDVIDLREVDEDAYEFDLRLRGH